MSKKILIAAGVPIAVLAVAGAWLGISINHNSKTFMKGSAIGHVDVSHLTAAQAGQKLNSEFKGRVISLHSADGIDKITLADVASYSGEKAAEKAFSKQNDSIFNLLPFSKGKVYQNDGFELDNKKLSEKLNNMKFMKSSDAPRNARVVYESGTVSIIPEHKGKQYIMSKVNSAVEQQITAGNTEIDLNSRALMRNPALTSWSTKIVNAKGTLDSLNGHKYVIKGVRGSKNKQVVLDSSRYMKYISVNDKGDPKIDENWLKGYVRSLNNNFSTIGKPVSFTGADDKRIHASGGTYGQVVDEKEEYKQLKSAILSGADLKMQAKMKSSGNDTLGKTYILLNIAKQKVYGYKDGKKILESSVVTGMDTPERRTSRGAYYIFFKKSPDVLKGPNYASPVHVFAAFHNGQGFHDADGWRSAYGGSIYKYNGSHGCCNMPLGAARRLYDNFGIGTPVIII